MPHFALSHLDACKAEDRNLGEARLRLISLPSELPYQLMLAQISTFQISDWLLYMEIEVPGGSKGFHAVG